MIRVGTDQMLSWIWVTSWSVGVNLQELGFGRNIGSPRHPCSEGYLSRLDTEYQVATDHMLKIY